jgi:flagellar basal-body rod protein FlgF
LAAFHDRQQRNALGIVIARKRNMIKGIFIALSGAVLKENQIELISQNLANSNSLAYKKVKMSFKDYLSNTESEQSGKIMTDLAAKTTNYSNGQITPTGNPLDIALEGDGFIALENNQFTRRGDLKRDLEGYLSTKNGIRVLGQRGPIQIPQGKVEIGLNGEVVVEKASLDTIKLVDFSDKQSLTRVGEDLYLTNQEGVPAKAVIRQGYLEGSNVDVFSEMIQIISTMREFGALQKVIQSFDESTSKMTDIARI